jgi:hypothetical protein
MPELKGNIALTPAIQMAIPANLPGRLAALKLIGNDNDLGGLLVLSSGPLTAQTDLTALQIEQVRLPPPIDTSAVATDPVQDLSQDGLTAAVVLEPSQALADLPTGSAARALAVASSQLGVLEGPNNDNKYGDWYGIPHAPYCAMFVSWVLVHAGVPVRVSTAKGFAWCQAGVVWYKAHDRWRTQPRPGDLAFFSWDGSGHAEHVGIVERVIDQHTIGTLEGNTNAGHGGARQGVYRRVRRGGILGYGRPAYVSSGRLEQWTHVAGTHKGPIHEGHFNCPTVSDWQRQMNTRHYGLTVDGDFGPMSQSAVQQFQQLHDLPKTGVLTAVEFLAAYYAPLVHPQ